MEAQARSKNVRISTRKVRLVADAIRNMPVSKAVTLLSTTQKHGASVLIKTLKSAIANAGQKGLAEADLQIVRLEVNGGPTLRRMHIGSRSHVRMYTKRSTHIRVVVGDVKKLQPVAAKKEVSSASVVAEEKKAEKPVKKTTKPATAKAEKKEEGK